MKCVHAKEIDRKISIIHAFLCIEIPYARQADIRVNHKHDKDGRERYNKTDTLVDNSIMNCTKNKTDFFV